MPSVSNSPTLIAQETPSWCFAAAEVMVRQYYGLPQMSQYEIARASTAALAQADLSLGEKWDLAQVLDSSADVTEDVGENHKSKIVELVRGQWNAFNHDATGGQFIAKPTWEAQKSITTAYSSWEAPSTTTSCPGIPMMARARRFGSRTLGRQAGEVRNQSSYSTSS
ncbi:papain-like cysteine protease family protein [Ensifer canadensis]